MTGNVIWFDEALCLGYDPDIWYPETSSEWAAPKAICDVCPVRLECLAAALLEEEGRAAFVRYGMRGGVTPIERAKMDHSQVKKRRGPSVIVVSRPWNKKV
jgi:hypothetical protein